mmetsp:Transcript_20417/g.56584  ORF Transcript_20417/g.56584 Transcript_20417/m.56584 type:complete len:225 (+) Transcript_20417:940-1614(+)
MIIRCPALRQEHSADPRPSRGLLALSRPVPWMTVRLPEDPGVLIETAERLLASSGGSIRGGNCFPLLPRHQGFLQLWPVAEPAYCPSAASTPRLPSRSWQLQADTRGSPWVPTEAKICRSESVQMCAPKPQEFRNMMKATRAAHCSSRCSKIQIDGFCSLALPLPPLDFVSLQPNPAAALVAVKLCQVMEARALLAEAPRHPPEIDRRGDQMLLTHSAPLVVNL